MDILEKLIPKQNKIIVDDIFNDDKFLNIYEKKLIVCKIKNTNNQSGGGMGKDEFYKLVNNYDTRRHILLYKYYERNDSLTKYSDLSINYILSKYKLENPIVFYMGFNEEMYIDSHLKIDYHNTLPQNNEKYKKIFVRFKMNKIYFMQNLDLVEKYINYIIDNHLKYKGTLILKLHLPTDNDKYLELLQKLCNKFYKVKLVLAKTFFQITQIGYIILQNKSKNKLMIDNMFVKNYEKFVSKFRKYILKSLELTNYLVNLNITNPMGYQVACSKIKYMLIY
jgi:hypothetical protein